MTMDKFLDTLTTWVVIITLVITPTQIAKAKETTNILNNGSFDNQTEGWELDGNVTYDGNDYGEINQSVRFSGAEGGSISQDIDLKILVESEEKIIDKAHGSILSIGCNNEATGAWCSNKGTIDNLDTVKTTITFSDGTQTETLNYNFTSDYNDGVITSTFNTELEKEFNINNTTVSVNVFGDDAGDWEGKFGSIIDDLRLSLTLSDVVIAQEPEIIEISPVVAPEAIINPVVDDIEVNPVIIEPVSVEPVIAEPIIVETVQIGSLDATSIVNTISSGIIDINPPEDMQIANLSSQISVISDIRAEQMNMEIADVGINNEMPTNIDAGADIPIDNNMPEIDMPTIEMPDIQMPDNLPEINEIQIESTNEIKNEPETLQEIREELPTELEEINTEDDLKENQNEQQEKASTQNEEVDGKNEESELSDDSRTEEKEPEPKEEISENEEKESEEKEETAEEEIKEEPSANEEKVVETAKSDKSEKKQGSDSPKSSDKKTSVSTVTPKIKSDIVVQKLDILTVVSFNKEYFEVKITDTLDLTKTEIDFYDGQGFNDSAYTQNNTDFFALDCKSDCWGNIHVRTNAIKIDSFRR